MAGLLELHLGHDDVVLEHGTAAGADGIASGAVHLDLDRAAVLAFEAGRRHLGGSTGWGDRQVGVKYGNGFTGRRLENICSLESNRWDIKVWFGSPK